MGGSIRMHDGGSPLMRRNETQINHVKGKRPAARDGHTGLILGEHMIILEEIATICHSMTPMSSTCATRFSPWKMPLID